MPMCQQDYTQKKQPMAAFRYKSFCFLVSTFFLVDMLRGSPDYLLYVVNDNKIE